MIFSGIILEGVTHPSLYENKVIFLGDGCVFECVDNNLVPIYKEVGELYATTALNCLWVNSEADEITRCVDIFNSGEKYPHLDFELYSEIVEISNRLFCLNIMQKELVIISIDNWDIHKIKYEGTAYTAYTNESIYLRSSSNEKVICFNHVRTQVWEYQLDGDHYLDFELKPQIHKDLLIINHAYDTIALNKHTGEEVWKYTFEAIPTSNVLMQEKIYVVCNAILYVIDPDTGKVEWSQDTGFPVNKFNVSDERNRIGIFPVGNYLYGVAQYDDNHEWLRLYNHDASVVLDKKTIPDYWLNPYGSILPTIHNGKIYQQVRNSYAFSSSGMMVLEIVEDHTEAKIIVSPRPTVTMIASPTLSELHKLEIYLEVDNLDDALRYGELLTQELYYATGYIGIYELRKNALDRKHNGIVELIIDDTSFKPHQEIEDYLTALAKRLNEKFEDDVAGDKKTLIKFILTRKPKANWNMSGEKLDWPAIRDQETPIS